MFLQPRLVLLSASFQGTSADPKQHGTHRVNFVCSYNLHCLQSNINSLSHPSHPMASLQVASHDSEAAWRSTRCCSSSCRVFGSRVRRLRSTCDEASDSVWGNPRRSSTWTCAYINQLTFDGTVAYMYTYMHRYVHFNILCIHVYIYVDGHVRIYSSLYMYSRLRKANYIRVAVCVCMYSSVRVCTCLYVRMYVCM